MLIGLVTGMVGVVVGMYAKNFEALTFMTSFVLQPLLFFSGVFYPIASLPAIWKDIAMLNPFHHMINLLRYSVTGYADVSPALSVVVVLVIGAIIFGVMQIVTKRALKTA